MKLSLIATPISEHVTFSDKGPLLKMFKFFEINYGSYQPFNFLPYLSLSMQYSILISLMSIFCSMLSISRDITCLVVLDFF